MEITDEEVILDGWVYNLKEFSRVHPGGSNAINIFGGCDATIHYYMIHPHRSLRYKALEAFRLRKAIVTDSKYICNSLAFQDLKQRVSRVVPYTFANAEWYIKAVILMMLAMYLEASNIYFGFNVVQSICLGIVMALIGLCIQHDANHGAISPNPHINMLWGYAQDWIGGSAILWKHHHVLLHHAFTNLDGNDPDITTDLIRLHENCKWKYIYNLQAVYVWFLLAFLPFNWHFKEIVDLVTMKHMGRKICRMARSEVMIGIIMRIGFILRFYVLPIYLYPSLYTVFCIWLCLVTGGLYLGVNFIISHNFEGVKKIKMSKDWAIAQVETSSTVGGRLLGYFHGGLNYQIEHHLFPRICHVHYYKIKPVVEKWCKEYNIKYTYFESIFDNIASCYRHLDMIGQNRI